MYNNLDLKADKSLYSSTLEMNTAISNYHDSTKVDVSTYNTNNTNLNSAINLKANITTTDNLYNTKLDSSVISSYTNTTGMNTAI